MSAGFLSTLGAFGDTSHQDKLGQLIEAAATRGFATHYTRQTDAWLSELDFLATFARECIDCNAAAGRWTILLEFEIPRRGKRPDAVLIADDLIFVIEFKVGATSFAGSDRWQVYSYGLDIRDFHSASHNRRIVPILVITGTKASTDELAELAFQEVDSEAILPVHLSTDGTGNATASLVCDLYDRLHDPNASLIDASSWISAPYRPTPNIIEAAQGIFAGHDVANISHSFAVNLNETCACLLDAVRHAQENQRRVICFVTGIPGAGKTLAGLNVAHDPFFKADTDRAIVFLSGNRPLVKIVREAIVQDRKRFGENVGNVKRTVETFIQHVHRFVGDYGIKDPTGVPHENVIVFDEAQRAWDRDAVDRKHSVQRSEPDLILDVMERSPNWCAIIALVGGGQEIHRGEAGLSEWGSALNKRSAKWEVFASPAVLAGGTSLAGQVLFKHSVSMHLQVREIPALHLDVSVRSPRARRISEWVNAIVNGEKPPTDAPDQIGQEFPVVLTRNLTAARRWLRAMSDGQERTGLLASSGALRLRAHGIEVSLGFRNGFGFEKWFLANNTDTRSSNFLEVAATEFECQGLELDWTCVCWGDDFVYSPTNSTWTPRRFKGSKWQKVKEEAESQYTRNKYRVLLTRARRGMVIWVPEGSETDSSRDPAPLNATAAHLHECGLPFING